MQPNVRTALHCLHPGLARLEEPRGHQPGDGAQASHRRGPEPGGAGLRLLGRRREHGRRGLGRGSGGGRGRRGGGRGVGSVRGRGRLGRRGGGGGGDVDGELHAVAAVAGDAADEVVLPRGLERDGGGAAAVAAERVGGGARRVVRRAHLRHVVRPAGVVEHCEDKQKLPCASMDQ